MDTIAASPSRELRVGTTVAAPADFTLAHVPAYLKRTFGGRDYGPLSLDFTVPLAGGLSLEKPVRIALEQADDGGVGVRWEPLEGGAFPHFHGTFQAQAGHGEICELTLTGSYVPPGGTAGRAFDALVGYRIARASLGGLLARIAAATAADYRVRSEL